MSKHPITPPPKLVELWDREWNKAKVKHCDYATHIATQAARWGADQELEACWEWITGDWDYTAFPGAQLRAARRPKPPSLKEQALSVLDDASDRLDSAHENTLRRALEALPDD